MIPKPKSCEICLAFELTNSPATTTRHLEALGGTIIRVEMHLCDICARFHDEGAQHE